MNIATATPETLKRIALHDRDGDVVSLYLSLGRTEFPTPRDRGMEVDALLHAAERELAGEEARIARERLQDRLRELDAHPGAPLRSLAVFSWRRGEDVEVVGLGEAVEPEARHAGIPHVAPLAAAVVGERWCAAVVSRRTTRIFLDDPTHLEEADRSEEDVHRRHAQGGWSQARFQRGIAEEVRSHLVHAAGQLFELRRADAFDALITAGPHELAGALERELHPTVRECLAGHVELDVERVAPVELALRLRATTDAHEAARERGVLDALVAAEGAHRAAAGIDDVLTNLVEGRVETLIVARDLAVTAHRCPRCGWAGASASACPRDGGELEPCDAADAAIIAASGQGAEVVVLRRLAEELRSRDGIAARLRY